MLTEKEKRNLIKKLREDPNTISEVITIAAGIAITLETSKDVWLHNCQAIWEANVLAGVKPE